MFISIRLIPHPLQPRAEAFNYSNYRIRGMIKNTLHVPKLIVSLHCICLFCSEYRQSYIRNCIHVPSCCSLNLTREAGAYTTFLTTRTDKSK